MGGGGYHPSNSKMRFFVKQELEVSGWKCWHRVRKLAPQAWSIGPGGANTKGRETEKDMENTQR